MILTGKDKRLKQWVAVYPKRDDLAGFGPTAYDACLDLIEQTPVCSWCHSIVDDELYDEHVQCAIQNSDYAPLSGGFGGGSDLYD